MKKPGYIRFVDNKVKFEYYELEKPNPDDFDTNPEHLKKFEEIWEITLSTNNPGYKLAMKKYEASKRVIEVSNVEKRIHPVSKRKAVLLLEYRKLGKLFIYDNQSCEAEVENNVAKIIKII